MNVEQTQAETEKQTVRRLMPSFCHHLVAALLDSGAEPTAPPPEHLGPEDTIVSAMGGARAAWRYVPNGSRHQYGALGYVRLSWRGLPFAARVSADTLRMAEAGNYRHEGIAYDIPGLAKSMSERFFANVSGKAEYFSEPQRQQAEQSS